MDSARPPAINFVRDSRGPGKIGEALGKSRESPGKIGVKIGAKCGDILLKRGGEKSHFRFNEKAGEKSGLPGRGWLGWHDPPPPPTVPGRPAGGALAGMEGTAPAPRQGTSQAKPSPPAPTLPSPAPGLTVDG